VLGIIWLWHTIKRKTALKVLFFGAVFAFESSLEDCRLKIYLFSQIPKLNSLLKWFLCGWQGRRDSNPQPTVLETATLPIELLPFGCAVVDYTIQKKIMSSDFLQVCEGTFVTFVINDIFPDAFYY
jgi:hypothetical protein